MTSATAALAHDISDGAHHVRLSGVLTMDRVSDLCTRLKPLNGGGVLVLDATAVTRADSSALALMTSLMRQAHERDMRVDLKPLPQAFSAIIELYGLHNILSAREA